MPSDVMIHGSRGVVARSLVDRSLPTIHGWATEDEWLMDEGVHSWRSEEPDENDDTDFRMFDDAQINALNQLRSLNSGRNTLKVTNLIDFGECDLLAAHPPPTSAVASLSEETESMRQRAQRATEELRRQDAELDANLLQAEIECGAMIGWKEGTGPSGTVMLARCQTCHYDDDLL